MPKKYTKQEKVRIVFFILMIITAIIIFIFSSQNGKKSTSTSDSFIKQIVKIIYGNNLDNINLEEITDNLSFYIRKLAHFTIYTIFGLNTFGFINTFNITKKRKILYTILIGVLYAVSDEFHQLFSEGRSASIKDVGIDSLGVCFGILIINITIYVKNCLDKKKE